jgi:hypothetical protein
MKFVRTYSLEWLDSLISVTLNPEKPYRQKLQASDIASLLEKVPVEALLVQTELTTHIFALNKESQVRHLVRKYYNALGELRGAILSYHQHPEFRADELSGLDALAGKCIADLIIFIEKRFAAYIVLLNPHNPAAAGEQPVIKPDAVNIDKHKVLCTLSADQIALILRALDESQIIKARSMNAVFKYIIPFLSTPHKENLSAGAVRSKAYNPEEADRDAAVEALYRIIKKIQGY